MEDNEKELMDSLRDIINQSAESLQGNALDEMRAMAHQLSDEFRKAIPEDCETAVFGIALTPDEEMDEARKRFDSGEALKSPFVNDINDETAKCAKVESIINGFPKERIFEFLEDFDGMMLLNGFMNPQGLIVRIKNEDSTVFEVFVTDRYMTTLKTLVTGERLVRQYSAPDGEAPQREHFDSEFELDLVKSAYVALSIPHLVKQQGEEFYDTMIQVIQQKIERKMRYHEED